MFKTTYKPGQKPLTTEEQMRLRYGDAYQSTPVPIENREPHLGDMVENFAAATERAATRAFRSGIKSVFVEKETFDARLNGCRNCPQNLWEENARLGLGKCKHEKCGCTRLKLWLETEKCPIEFWK